MGSASIWNHSVYRGCLQSQEQESMAWQKWKGSGVKIMLEAKMEFVTDQCGNNYCFCLKRDSAPCFKTLVLSPSQLKGLSMRNITVLSWEITSSQKKILIFESIYFLSQGTPLLPCSRCSQNIFRSNFRCSKTVCFSKCQNLPALGCASPEINYHTFLITCAKF